MFLYLPSQTFDCQFQVFSIFLHNYDQVTINQLDDHNNNNNTDKDHNNDNENDNVVGDPCRKESFEGFLVFTDLYVGTSIQQQQRQRWYDDATPTAVVVVRQDERSVLSTGRGGTIVETNATIQTTTHQHEYQQQ
jgi:hypothetical protein